MRLSEWRAKAPAREALGPKVMAVLGPVLGVLGVDDDPQVWVLWGDDPSSKYSIYAPTLGGLVVVMVRPNQGGMGPRAIAKIVRWSRLQIGELAVETEGAHRMISFQVESAVLRGADSVADAIGRFALVLFAAIEGRPWPDLDAPGRRRVTGRGAAAAGKGGAARGGTGRSGAKTGAAKGASTKGAPAKASTGTRGGSGGRSTAANPRLPALPARTATSGGSATDRRRSQA